MNRFSRQMKKSDAKTFSSRLLLCYFMRLAASTVCSQWKMLRMIVDKTGRSAIVARRVTVVVSPRPELVAWGTPVCGGDQRFFGQMRKRPQVPAKGAWPCATLFDLTAGLLAFRQLA